MSNLKIVRQVEELVKPIVDALDLELVDVEFVKEGSQWYLRVYIDKPGGVDIDDCQAVSERLDVLLDEKDPIPQSYILEVSSPGIERPLKKPEDYRRFAGSLVTVNTYAPIDGKKSFTGNLIGLHDDGVHLDVDGKRVVIPKDKISLTRLAVEF